MQLHQLSMREKIVRFVNPMYGYIMVFFIVLMIVAYARGYADERTLENCPKSTEIYEISHFFDFHLDLEDSHEETYSERREREEKEKHLEGKREQDREYRQWCRDNGLGHSDSQSN